MSVAEFPGQHPTDDYPSQLDRTPPQDQVAEQSVLGAMLMSKDAIADVVEMVRGTDFYRPAHETVFDAILDLCSLSSVRNTPGTDLSYGGARRLNVAVAMAASSGARARSWLCSVPAPTPGPATGP